MVLTKEDFKAAAVEKTQNGRYSRFRQGRGNRRPVLRAPTILRRPKAATAPMRCFARRCARPAHRHRQVHLARCAPPGRHRGDWRCHRADDDAFRRRTGRCGGLALPADSAVRKQDLEIAKTLVNNLNAPWKPSKDTDEYRDNLMRIIKGKMKGKSVALEAREQPREGKVIDLMERLRASLAQSAPSSGRRTAARAATKTSQRASRTKKRPRRHAA